MADGWKLRTPDQQDVTLTAYERDMLRCLIEAEGRPIDRETLIGALTPDVHDFDPHRLEMVIYRLRRKIRAVSEWTLPLEAVRGVGYLVNDMREQSGVPG
ncbi:Virulence transcriptional regulatory protein PhoP [Alcanivorax sp. ALC70]|nr:Virulence transcriptional regulatory protein PhoP [Alcanivorax sp. ALC70]